MLPSNRAFNGMVDNVTNNFVEYLIKLKIANAVYPSRHFFERIVERNLEKQLPFLVKMVYSVYVQLKRTTFNNRTYKVRWKELIVIAGIRVGEVSDRRRVVVITVWDKDSNEGYDEEIVL